MRAAFLGVLALAMVSLTPGTSGAPAAVETAAVMAHSGLLSGGVRATGAAPPDRFVRVADPISGKSVHAPGAPATRRRQKRTPSPAPGVVRGSVREAADGRAVPGLAVTLVSTDPRYEVVVRETTTGAGGEFSFAAVDPGPWLVTLDAARLPARYAARRLSAPIQVARSQKIDLPPFALEPGACTFGVAEWNDGYPLADAELLVAPRRRGSYAVGGLVAGDGTFSLCGVPAESAMVWLDLGDGRHVGAFAPLAPGDSAALRFAPAPPSRLPGTVLSVSVRLADGRAVGYAEVVVGGRRRAAGGEPALVYLREAVTDRDGVAEFTLPHGSYRILAMNPREGEWQRVEEFVVAEGTPRLVAKELVVGGTSSAGQRKAWTGEFYAQAEDAIFLWDTEGLGPAR